MIPIWIDHEHMKILSYGANAKGKRAVVKVEIEVTNPDALGWLLREICKAQDEGLRARAATAEAAREEKRCTKERGAVEHRKPLSLPFYGDGT